jgi:hypothetical protein
MGHKRLHASEHFSGGLDPIDISLLADSTGYLHLQNTDQYLDYGGASQISATQAKAAHTHISSDGTDHTYIDQDLRTTSSPSFSQISISTTPTDSSHVARKDYVDNLIEGLDWQESVVDIVTSAPGSPDDGARYIATTAWGSGSNNDIAIYDADTTSWSWISPDEGTAVWVEDVDLQYVYNGSSWVTFGSTSSHNNLSGLQGGQASEYYHLTSTQHTDLTDAGDSTLHYHTSDRNLANASGILSVTHGGTGVATFSAGIVTANGTNNLSTITDNHSQWDDAYSKRVDTWNAPFSFSSNAVSLLVLSDDLGVNGSNQLYVKDGGIDHNQLANTHNLTSDIDHDQLTNFDSSEHFTQDQITTVGTITSGIWHGTDIEDDYITSTLTGKTYNGLTVTTGADTFTLTRGTTDLTVSADCTLNQSLATSSSPTFGGLTLTGLSGVLKASAGVVSGSATIDDIGDGTSYKKMTADQYTWLDQDVGNGATPAFNSVTLNNAPVANSDAVRKDYVDNLIEGLDWQESVVNRVSSEPSSPADGARYIALTAWGAGTDDDIAVYDADTTSWSWISPDEGTAVWVEDEDVQYTYNGSNWVTFGSTTTHSNLSGLQGGTSNEYYHLTSAQHTDLTDSDDCTIHYHASDRARANHTGTQSCSTLSDLTTYDTGITSVGTIDTGTWNGDVIGDSYIDSTLTGKTYNGLTVTTGTDTFTLTKGTTDLTVNADCTIDQNLQTSANVEFAELKIKVYAQASEPTLGANEYMAIWKDTDDSDRVWLIFRRGDGDNVMVELA